MHPPVIAPVFIVAFSGHRPNDSIEGRSSNDLAACQPLIQDALKKLQEQAAQVGGSIQLFTSVAEGADLMACAVAEELGIPLHIILPLPEAQFKDDFSGKSAVWATVQSYIQRARIRHKGWSLRIASSTHERSGQVPGSTANCYADANHELLTHADALVTVALGVDNQPTSISGAQQVWKDAAERALPRINIDPRTKQLSHLEDLNCLTEETDGNKRPGLELLNSFAHHKIEPLKCEGTVVDLETALKTFTEAANGFAKSVRDNLRKIIWLHGIASFLAAFAIAQALAYEKDYYILFSLAALELILIAAAEVLHNRTHHKGIAWLDCRAAGENIRMLS